jgi:two-component system response regulator TctD
MIRRILLVDDEVAFLLPMEKMLRGPGVAVDTAETYEQALGFLAGSEYDAVVVDVRLGGALSREGLAILDFIRSRGGDTKVIVMTGYGSPDVIQDVSRLNADCYFEKPVSVRTLSDALSHLRILGHESAR